MNYSSTVSLSFFFFGLSFSVVSVKHIRTLQKGWKTLAFKKSFQDRLSASTALRTQMYEALLCHEKCARDLQRVQQLEDELLRLKSAQSPVPQARPPGG